MIKTPRIKTTRIKNWHDRRGTAIFLFVLVAAAATFVLLPPRTQAIDCGNGESEPVSHEWLITPESLAKGATGYCEPHEVCRQWCFVSCGEATAQPFFDCFPE